MVNLSRIYTRTGDGGTTRLGDASEVPKTDVRVEAYGDVDELNSLLGVVLAADPESPQAQILRWIQNDLFDVGADLCRPLKPDESEGSVLRLQAEQVTRLERAIDDINEQLAPLDSFVLPGGTTPAAWLHLARAVCRRAERRVWQLAERDVVNEQTIVYLNRLSDLLFVMARSGNLAGEQGEILWEPGQNRSRGRRDPE